jgi:predicted lipoprotein with Yx(FWY)xxD motif
VSPPLALKLPLKRRQKLLTSPAVARLLPDEVSSGAMLPSMLLAASSTSTYSLQRHQQQQNTLDAPYKGMTHYTAESDGVLQEHCM